MAHEVLSSVCLLYVRYSGKESFFQQAYRSPMYFKVRGINHNTPARASRFGPFGKAAVSNG